MGPEGDSQGSLLRVVTSVGTPRKGEQEAFGHLWECVQAVERAPGGEAWR